MPTPASAWPPVTWPHVRRLARDLRVACGALRRTPGFSAAAILTIALGAGANTAVFSAVESVLLHPIPAADVRGLVALQTDLVRSGPHDAALSPETVYDLGDRRDVFAGVGGYRAGLVTLTGTGAPQRVSAVATVGAFFETLGVRPLLGRLYDRDDVERGDPHVVVLSHEFWRTVAGADPSIVGKALRLDDSTYRVVAVLPPGFDYPRGTRLYTPHALEVGIALGRNDWGASTVTATARPRPGVTPGRLRAALDEEIVAVRRRHPLLDSLRIEQRLVARPFVDVLAGTLRPILTALLACVGFVLMIACANVASLQLVRTAVRAREIAVRRALGAPAGAVVRQVGAESVLVALAGGVVGLGIGAIAIAALRHVDPARLGALADARLDGPVLAWSFGVATATAAVFGTGPLWRALAVNAADALKSEARGTSAGVGRSRLLRGVVVVQVALALVLLLGGATAWRSVRHLLDVDPGFRPDGVATMRVVLPPARYHAVPWNGAPAPAGPSTATFFDALLDRLRVVPGVTAVGAVQGAPFGYVRQSEHGLVVHVAGRAPAPDDPVADVWIVGGDYFRALGIPIRRGRAFAAGESMCTATSGVIVDEALARRLLPGGSALGERLNQCLGPIVGVVGTSKKADLAAPDRGALFEPYGTHPPNDLTLVVRTALPTAAAARLMRDAVRAVDPDVAPGDVRALALDVSRSAAPQRLASAVLAALAALAVTLAALGVFGVLSYGTAQRGREIGIRAALGASPAALVRLVLGGGAGLVAAGLAAGLALYLAIAGLAAGIVYGVSPRAPSTVLAGLAGVGAVALVACWLPAWRVARVDPARTLRAE